MYTLKIKNFLVKNKHKNLKIKNLLVKNKHKNLFKLTKKKLMN